ncbi:MAG: hypothetical protein KME49_32010 [Brasilonema octagenarum HA4186-MV1]|jgi:hypothetical protein|uniref:Uncharacterized protein n=1 Tax=Brasilonema sennae CENA114 TaxID=415709 RepID=A0A856MN79_9CYAN|nr:hypothetical protein [Brasilonema sennae]MBW4630012.1 hypothetical protein [Brasilonema octagenarum HA4186-MV1]QDL10687.1 hypothetical protein DP114_24780 [Brasilonema sennae CENA114]
MSTYNPEYYPNACEFTVPIKLNVPIFIEPTVAIKAVEPVTEKVRVHLEPDIYLRPEVAAAAPVCIPQNGYNKPQLPYS